MPELKVDLQKAVEKILKDYGDIITDEVEKAIPKIAKDTVKELKSKSPKKTGEYASGGKAEIKKGRLSTYATVYNAKKPGLPHLLEFGHAKTGGGRTRSFPHVKPAEAHAVEAMEKEIEAAVDAATGRV